jgi:4-amino-4-deoxy-L-arabinose transferase-like glycosyltransferase
VEGDKARWGLALILLAFCALGALYSVVVPLFEAPDEIWHFSFVRVLATQRALPVQPAEGKDMWLREAGQPPLYYFVAAPLVALLDTSDFPDFVRFNVAHPAVTASSQSQAHNVFIHTPHEAFPYQGAVLAVHLVRLLTVLWGAGAIAGVYLVAHEVAPSRPGLALVCASVAAFNTHLVFISSIVNNDAASICLCSFTLWLSVRVGRGKSTRRSEMALGLFLGLALLSKVSALALLPLVALALCLAWWRERDIQALLARGNVIFGLAALVAAWWYVRNWVLYGDPLAWRVWLIDIGVQPIGPVEVLRQSGQVATSFWSPYDGLFPAWVFWALALVLALAVAGWVRLSVRREWHARVNGEGLLLAGIWFALLVASLVRYMTITPAAAGRLLFPGMAAFALFLVLGLEAIVPRRWAALALGGVGGGLLALSIASPLCAIAPRFAPPLLGSTRDIPLETAFDDAVFGGVRLWSVEVTPHEAQLDETVNVTLYWEAQATPPDDLRAVVRLWTLGGRLVGQRDTTPAGEIYPPDLWRAGDVVRDIYPLALHKSGPAMCRVEVNVLDGDEPLGQAWSDAALKLAAPPAAPEIAHPLAYTLGEEIELVGYDVSGGRELEVTLYWRVLAGLDEDYTVFVHLLDAQGALRGQADGPPLHNDYPTSHWSPGETLADTHVVPLKGGLPPGAHLLVGLYRLADGARLPVHDATGERIPNDAIWLDVPR